jgi:hypothetical protein|nr:MAG TPA: hypothetical protein [Caudoviricetes sp.]
MAQTKITLKSYIANPLGDNTVTHREMYRNLYSEKLDKMIEKRNMEKIKYHLYYTLKNEYYVHFKIPSESVDDFYYDVVFYFYDETGEFENSRSLNDYYVKFFSNDPAFNFTYTYVFNKVGLLIPELKPKLSDFALKNEAKVTNPNKNIGYIKSVYISYLLMERYGLFYKVNYKTYGDRYNKNNLINQIVDYNDKQTEYNLRKDAQLNIKKNTSKIDKIQAANKIKPKSTDNTKFITRSGLKEVKRIVPKENAKSTKRGLGKMKSPTVIGRRK